MTWVGRKREVCTLQCPRFGYNAARTRLAECDGVRLGRRRCSGPVLWPTSADPRAIRARLLRLRWWQLERAVLAAWPVRHIHAFMRATVDALARLLA